VVGWIDLIQLVAEEVEEVFLWKMLLQMYLMILMD
jgi:hypothetical protein